MLNVRVLHAERSMVWGGGGEGGGGGGKITKSGKEKIEEKEQESACRLGRLLCCSLCASLRV